VVSVTVPRLVKDGARSEGEVNLEAALPHDITKEVYRTQGAWNGRCTARYGDCLFPITLLHIISFHSRLENDGWPVIVRYADRGDDNLAVCTIFASVH
jgi:hypothetical protein